MGEQLCGGVEWCRDKRYKKIARKNNSERVASYEVTITVSVAILLEDCTSPHRTRIPIQIIVLIRRL
jgi:hypothetical protein